MAGDVRRILHPYGLSGCGQRKRRPSCSRSCRRWARPTDSWCRCSRKGSRPACSVSSGPIWWRRGYRCSCSPRYSGCRWTTTCSCWAGSVSTTTWPRTTRSRWHSACARHPELRLL